MKILPHGPKRVEVLPFDDKRGCGITATVQGLTAFGDKLEAGVNWPGIGKVSPADARIFAAALLKAADEAETMLHRANVLGR